MLFSPADWLQVPAANECKGAAFLFLSAKRSCEFDRAALSISVPDKGSEFHRWRPVRECSRGLGVQAGGAQMSSPEIARQKMMNVRRRIRSVAGRDCDLMQI
jgi:hypothetical protein